MAKFIGSGPLKKYSGIVNINKPILVQELSKFLKLPKDLSENLIVVRENKKLNDDDTIQNNDEIHIFFAAMGG